jgi:hypothetical protein
MKKITEDLEIISIDISKYGQLLGAVVTFKFLDEYSAKALYYQNSSGNSFFETTGESGKVHESFCEEVENNEDEIIEWVNDQILSI